MMSANSLSRKNFPVDFVFGAASSAYQYEGGAREGGKGLSNWDTYTHKYPDKIDDGSNGDVAVDSYHRYKEDVSIMKDMGMDAYRFSIAWSRILPNGTLKGGVNDEGIQYYNNLINELLSQGIEPFPTLFHWDVPQALEEKYQGFLSPYIIDDFGDYAEVCYKAFGDRVKHWMTLNEPWTFSYGGYVKGFFPPGNVNNSGTEPYIVSHHLLLAHSVAVEIYRKKYQESQKGQIGIALNYFWMVPSSENQADIIAAEQASDFMFGWFMDPITYGEYPQCMQSLVKERLPNFTNKQSQMLKGSSDFLGLNYYTANYAAHAPPNANGAPCYSTDSCSVLSSDCYKIPIGEPTASDWLYIYPPGIRDILLQIKRKYNNPIIYITENGIPNEGKLPLDEALKDDQRTQAYIDHLSYLRKAIEEGVNVRGFFVWSLLDNFEWNCGYTMRFGIYYVDFKDGLKRHPKKSAIWFKSFLENRD